MQPTVETIPLLTLASGDRLSLNVYRYRGAQPGKRCYVQANLHGAEIIGNGLISALMQWLDTIPATQLAGEICLVPVCNPLATNQRSHFFATGRYNPYDGRDWNRIFWAYDPDPSDLSAFVRSQLTQTPTVIQRQFRRHQRQAFEAAHQGLSTPQSRPWREHYRYCLQSLSLEADYVVDLHSSSNQGLPYLYCFASRQESGQLFGFDYGILMADYGGESFDEAFMEPWLALEEEFADQGRPLRFDVGAYTLELGSSMVMDSPFCEQALQGMINFWAAKGLLTLPDYGVFGHDTQFGDRRRIEAYYAPRGGFMTGSIALKQRVKKGEKLYELLQFGESLPNRLAIPAATDGIIFDLGLNHSVNQGEYVLSLWKTDGDRRQ